MRAAALALSVVALAAGQVFRAPPPAFEQNVGQFGGGILFAGAGRAFEPGRVRVTSALTFEFAGSAPTALVPQGEPFPINVYRGVDRARWRTGVRTFPRLLQAGLYPGIDAEWRIENRQVALRLSAAPGANVQAVLLRFSGDPAPSVAISLEAVSVHSTGWDGPFLRAPVATETCSTGPRRLLAAYQRHDPQTARLTVAAANAACPLVIEIPFAQNGDNFPIGAHAVDASGSVVLSGCASFAAPLEPPSSGGCLAKLRRDGTLAFLTIFDGGVARDVKIGNGEVFVTGHTWGGLPVTADAPQRTFGGGYRDLFLARFRADGALLSSTYWGGAGEETLEQTALDPAGNVYICGSAAFPPTTPGALAPPEPHPAGGFGFLAKWAPGLPRFAFSATFPYAVDRVALGRDGSIGLVSRGYDARTTPGVLQTRPLSYRDLYCAKLDATASRYLWGTYLPTAGPVEQPGFASPTGVVIDQAGDLWIGGALRVDGADAYVLLKLKGDGSRLLFAESSPVRLADASDLTLDAAGNLLVVGPTAQMAHPTSPDARLRGGCDDSASVYLRKLSPQGALLYATYLRAGQVSAFDGQGRPYLAVPAWYPQTLEPIELAPRSEPALECVVNTAGRGSQYLAVQWDPRQDSARRWTVAPGQLLTLLGTALGPLASVDARPDPAGNFPTALAGVRVLFDGVPAPILSAQYGLVTLQAPANLLPGASVSLKVEAGGGSSSTWTATVVPSALQLATVDVHGFGHAAALNQDGSLNSPSHPARPGSVVSVWGTGAGINQPVRVLVGGLFAEVFFAGQAPGLAQGVTQVNFRLPPATSSGLVPVRVLAGELEYRQVFPWPRVVISVGN